MNIQKMVQFGRKRKNGNAAYYTHPQSVSMEFAAHAPADKEALKTGVIGALLHDYLEEGNGVSRESVAELKGIFSGLGERSEELALLTEPNYIEDGKRERNDLLAAVNYDTLKEKTNLGKKELETVMFGLMMESSPLMQLVVPVDKLDNVG